jgi:hypothetical protein
VLVVVGWVVVVDVVVVTGTGVRLYCSPFGAV